MFEIGQNMQDTLRFSMLSYLKTGNPIYDTILSTIIVSFLSYVMKFVYDTSFFSFHDFYDFYDLPNSIRRYTKLRNC